MILGCVPAPFYFMPVLQTSEGKEVDQMSKDNKKRELIEFGNQLYEMRRQNDLSQMQLADILDIDRRQISRYETGEAEMGALLYVKMQNALSPKVDGQLAEMLQLWSALSDESKAQLINLAKLMK